MKELRSEIKSLSEKTESDIKDVRSDIKSLAEKTESDIKSLSEKTEPDMKELRSEIKTNSHWSIGLLITMFIGFITLILMMILNK